MKEKSTNLIFILYFKNIGLLMFQTGGVGVPPFQWKRTKKE